MAAKLGLFLALNLLVFAAAVHGCTPYCGPADPTPPIQPAPSTYAPEPPAPTPSTTNDHGHGSARQCPMNVLELQVCASILDGLVKISLPEDRDKCCRLLGGLADIDAAACLCTVLKADVLGVPLTMPIDISLSLNRCGRRNCPPGLTCSGY